MGRSLRAAEFLGDSVLGSLSPRDLRALPDCPKGGWQDPSHVVSRASAPSSRVSSASEASSRKRGERRRKSGEVLAEHASPRGAARGGACGLFWSTDRADRGRDVEAFSGRKRNAATTHVDSRPSFRRSWARRAPGKLLVLEVEGPPPTASSHGREDRRRPGRVGVGREEEGRPERNGNRHSRRCAPPERRALRRASADE